MGVYGPRKVCQRVADAGYAAASFVSAMSSGSPATREFASDAAAQYGRELIGLYNVLENYDALSRSS